MENTEANILPQRPTDLAPDQIRSHVKLGHFESLIGVAESGAFECKRSPYQIDKDHGKQELSKDISALANARGGLLVIGLETTKHPTYQRDIVTAVKAFGHGLVDTERYGSILKSWIYPPLNDIHITWYPSADDDSIGIVIIDVPQQERAAWPFLVMRHIETTGRRSEFVFGLFERKQSLVDHLSLPQVHALLRDGFRHASLGEDLGRIEQKLDLIHSFGLQEREVQQRIEWGRVVTNRLAQLREVSELSDRPAYSLVACPSWESTPSGLFERRRTDIVSLLKEPPEIRHTGFDLNTFHEPRRTSNGAWLAVLSGVKALACWDDACLMFVGDGDGYLCWGNEIRRNQYPLLINQLVLIESTYLFVLLTQRLLALSSATPAKVNYTLQLSDMQLGREHAKLQGGPLDPYRHSMKRLEADSLKVAIIAATNEHPGRTALRIVADLYDQFGFTESAVPYVEAEDGTVIISAQKITAID